MASLEASYLQVRRIPRAGQGISCGRAERPGSLVWGIGLTWKRYVCILEKQNRRDDSPSQTACQEYQVRPGDFMTGETDIRIERRLPGYFCVSEGRFRRVLVRQTKPISCVLGLKTGVGRENKANWSRREAENGDWPAGCRACPEPRRRIPRSGLYLSPLSDDSSCTQICKAKPIFRGFRAQNADFGKKQSQSKPIRCRRASLQRGVISSRILPVRPGRAGRCKPAGRGRTTPGGPPARPRQARHNDFFEMRYA